MQSVFAVLVVGTGCSSSGSTPAAPPPLACTSDWAPSGVCICGLGGTEKSCPPADGGGGAITCCAGDGYPSQGVCACVGPVHCERDQTGDYCGCTWLYTGTSGTTLDSCMPPTGGHCCLYTSSCLCAPGTCPPSTTEVSTCESGPSTALGYACHAAAGTGTAHAVDKCL